MDQGERRKFLIEYLLGERGEYGGLRIPEGEAEGRYLLRSLLNVRGAGGASEEFLKVQDEYLKEESARRGIAEIGDMEEVGGGIYLWRGDITTLRVDAIVNAANSALTGCYVPNHRCIDNAIHTFAGIQLRRECSEIMERQGFEEPPGRAKITPAFNLPCRFVIHTVGPIVFDRLTDVERNLLESCYESCLNLASERSFESIAFCCISTGEFRFPNEDAAEIAVRTVRAWKKSSKSAMKVVFNVFREIDEEIYRRILCE